MHHIFKTTKVIAQPLGKYILLLVPSEPWTDISLDLALCLPKTRKWNDSILVVVDRFSKMEFKEAWSGT